jgi:transposase
MDCTIGIDVSKAKLDVALLGPEGKWRNKVVGNDEAGFVALLSWMQAHAPAGAQAVHVCLEATGAYHEAVAVFLHDSGVRLSVVNPLVIKRFVELEGVRNKTDTGDAKALALYAARHAPEPWQAPSQAVRTLQALVARLDTLGQMRQSECNRLGVAHEAVKASLQAVIAQLDASIEQVRSQIRQTIDDDPELGQRDALLSTIPGLGERTIAQLLACIGRPERFASVKALAAYASLSPLIRQSGTSLNSHRGTHPCGHRHLKTALYFPAMVAARCNPPVAALWQRLRAQGKPGKVVVVACMHKLLAIAFGVLKSGKPFEAHHLGPQPGAAGG